MAHASFKGLRVLSLESRRAKEVEKLIRTYGGEAIVVPAMREVGLDSNAEAFEFAEGLLRGEFDLVIFMTGVGVRTMLNIVKARFDGEEFLDALRKVKIAARGAKPATALRELKVPLHVVAEEPSTVAGTATGYRRDLWRFAFHDEHRRPGIWRFEPGISCRA